ncbi:MAG: sugar transferase [Lentisphaerales bacterium]|nr:sugar transferase [Lentisphaerales bacterium]
MAFGKRILDLFIVFFSLLFLWPLFLLVGLLIKIFDPGPIFFVQERIGRCGETFNFIKFRSMPVNTGDIPSDKIGDIKIAWIGKIIRRTSIDELPQLLNVAKGEMSIVGPRPSIASQTELVEQRRNNGSLKCVPGLTGLAQIKSYDGMTVEEKASFDGIYSAKVTFLGDFKIILCTFLYLLKPPPKY